MTHAFLGCFRSPPSFARPAAVCAFVPLFSGETYGKHRGNVPCNLARTMHLASRVGFLNRCTP